MATITFDQTGLSAGILDRARTDGLGNGATVTITVSPSGGVVEFIDVPQSDTTSVSSLSQSNPSTWTFTPSSNVWGTWLVQYTVSGQSVRRLFATRYPASGLRAPAFNEKASIDATIANGSTHVVDSDDNESGSYKGYAPSLVELYSVAEDTVANTISLGNDISTLQGDVSTLQSTVSSQGSDIQTLQSDVTNLFAYRQTQNEVVGPNTVTMASNTTLFVDVSAGAVTVNLNTGDTDGAQVLIKLMSPATNSCTIDAHLAETIDGALTLNLTSDYEWALLVRHNGNWFQVG